MEEVVLLELGDTRSGTTPEPTSRRPSRPQALVAAAALLVLAVAAPQPREVPTADDLRLEVLEAAPTAALDGLGVTLRLTASGRSPVEVRLPGGRFVELAVGGSGETTLPLTPECDPTPTVRVDASSSGGSTRLRLPVSTAPEAFSAFCPPPVVGPAVSVTAWADASGPDVRVRLTNHGSDEALVLSGRAAAEGVADACCGLTLAEFNDSVARPAAVAGRPGLPVLLEPGESAVLALRPGADPCALDSAAARLQVQSQSAAVSVTGQDEVVAALLLAADVACGAAGAAP